jgi:hypothetical protein
MAVVGKKKVAGAEYELHANSFGSWSIYDPESGVTLGSGDTIDKAVAQARATLTKGRIRINEKVYKSTGEVMYITGMKVGNRKVLVREPAGPRRKEKTDQWDAYTKVFTGDTPKEVRDRFTELQEEMNEIRREVQNIQRKHMMNIGEIAQAKIAEASES